MIRVLLALGPAVMAMYLPFCAAEVRPVVTPKAAPIDSLWTEPVDLAERDLFYGSWGPEAAPHPQAPYTFIERKHTGVNPGMTVRDVLGRQWSVKQRPLTALTAEGPIELVLSRVLSAVGYHQPPVYYLPAFTLVDDWGTHTEPGGRFRLKDPRLKDRGEWSWQQNAFVGTKPYQGLLVILMLFNSTDLKNSNNTLYEHRAGDLVEHWYVVRDLGSALGTTGRLSPIHGDPVAFARRGFIKRVKNGFIEFDYRGWHQELVRERITIDDVLWATTLLGRLSDRQWDDAFRAAGYTPDISARFIDVLRARILAGTRLPMTAASTLGKGD